VAGAGMFPALLLFGVIAGASPALCEDVTLEGLRDSYEEASNALRLRGRDISAKRVRTISRAVGHASLEARERRLACLGVSNEAEGKRLAVAMDGGRILIRTDRRGRKTAKGYHTYAADWREPKLFIIYELDAGGRKKRKGLERCDGTIGGPEDIMRLLVAELRAMGAQNAKSITFLGDGAKWIWNRIDQIIEEVGIDRARVSTCLDYYHAVEHLASVAEAKTFASQIEKRTWFDTMKKLLKKAPPAVFLAELAKSRRRGNAVIRREYAYFKTNMSAIDYAKLSREKQPIGSGAIESAVRRIVNLRIKGAGTFWKLENAEAALHLRCQLKTNNWSVFYADLLNSLAA
jgi:hypothetical protein